MNEYEVSDKPRIHLLSGILAGGAANGATHLQQGLRKAGVNSSLHYPASLKIGSEIGPSTVTDFMHGLFRKRSWGAMAESETYAHLEHLRIKGDAERIHGPDGRFLYITG